LKLQIILKDEDGEEVQKILSSTSAYPTAGVSNSISSEGHIPKKKCSAGRSLLENSFCGSQFTRKVLKQAKLDQNLQFLTGRVFETPVLQSVSQI
jgi:hypothetical protein